MSVIFTPFILWKSLPTSAPSIIDFFREVSRERDRYKVAGIPTFSLLLLLLLHQFTVHVDELGYVCSFAIFDFRRHGNANFGAPEGAQNDRLSSKEGSE